MDIEHDSSLPYRILSQRKARAFHFSIDLSKTQTPIRRTRIPGQGSAFGRRARRRQRKHQGLRRMVCDPARLVMVLLMNMAVEHGHMLERSEQLDYPVSVARGPVPLRVEIEQRAVREQNQRLAAIELRKIARQPLQLFFTDQCRGIRYIVEHNEVNALMIERVVRSAEELAERLATVK